MSKIQWNINVTFPYKRDTYKWEGINELLRFDSKSNYTITDSDIFHIDSKAKIRFCADTFQWNYKEWPGHNTKFIITHRQLLVVIDDAFSREL